MVVQSEAYKNLPDKFQRQHKSFTFGGVDTNPVAQVKYPAFSDYLADKALITDDQQRAIDSFSRIRMVAMAGMDYATLNLDGEHGATARIEDADEATITARDEYHRILQVLSPIGLDVLIMAASPPPPMHPDFTVNATFMTWLARACTDVTAILKD